MERNAATPCPECQRLRAQLAALQAQIDSLRAALTQLQDQLANARLQAP